MNLYHTDVEAFILKPRKYWIQVMDVSLVGSIDFSETMALEDIQNMLEDARGSWTRLPNTDGDVLLDDPVAWVFLAEPAEVDPYPDFEVTRREINPA